MDWDTVVCSPLGDLKVTDTVPLVVLSSNSYEIETLVGTPLLGMGDPPTTVAVNPLVAATVTTVPAAIGLKATGLASDA